MSHAAARLPNHAVIPEGHLLFDPSADATAQHPLKGLVEHGPYGGKLTPAIVRPPIRLAYVTIEGFAGTLRDYLNDLENVSRSTARNGYFPEYGGFERVYGVPLHIPQGRRDVVSLIPEQAARETLVHPEPDRYQGRPCRTTVFSSVISATARRGPSLPYPLPFSPP